MCHGVLALRALKETAEDLLGITLVKRRYVSAPILWCWHYLADRGKEFILVE